MFSELIGLVKALPSAVGGVVKFVRRARLELTVGNQEPWAVPTRWEQPPDRSDPIRWVADGAVNYYRVRVRNFGGSTALGCHVAIAEVWYVARNIWRQLEALEPVDLNWSGRPGLRTMSLSPHQEEYCDIGHVVSNYIQSNLIRPTELRHIRGRDARPTRPARFILDAARQDPARVNALEQGHYVLKLIAYAENARTTPLYIDLWVSGRFAEMTDRYTPLPFAGVSVLPRSRVPEANTVHDELSPISEEDETEQQG